MITLAAVVSYTTPEHVTKWGPRIALTLIVLIIIGLALWGMRRGWKNKAHKQDAIPAPATVPTTEAALIGGPTEGTYLASTTAGQWLDRIVVHSLGVPSRATVSLRPRHRIVFPKKPRTQVTKLATSSTGSSHQ